MGRLLVILSTVLAVLGAFALLDGGKSESRIRASVVRLSNNGHSCSGEQVSAKSGAQYILTAGHCKVLADKDGNITVHTEAGRVLQRKVVAEDSDADLLLLEPAPGIPALDLASTALMGSHIRTFTHGHALDTYKTEGQLIQDMQVQIGIAPAFSAEDQEACASLPKQKLVDSPFGPFCILDVTETVTDAMVMPGSSGGAAVDASGDLIGVVSAGDDKLGLLVPLAAIHEFTDNY